MREREVGVVEGTTMCNAICALEEKTILAET